MGTRGCLDMGWVYRGLAWWNETFGVTLGDTGLGHGVGLGDKWGHRAGTWGGFGGPAWWNELWGKTWGHRAGTWGGFRGQAGTRGCDKGTSGDTGLGLGDQHGGLH